MAVKKKGTKKSSSGAKTERSSSGKYSFVDELLAEVLEIAEVGKKGEVKLKKSDLKGAVEKAMQEGLKAAARGERVKFPAIGTLSRKDVPARKGGKAINPFTKEEMVVKPRPASMKPRWTFVKETKDFFSNKKNW